MINPTRLWQLLLIAVLCLSGGQYLAQADTEPGEPGQVEPPQVRIPLQKHLRLLIRPTILGLVPPDDPGHFGEVFVRLTTCLPGRSIVARYEIKESGLWNVDPDAEIPPGLTRTPRPQTRIRRGELTATGLADSSTLLPPLLWDNGDFSTDSGLLWISQQAFAELQDEGSTEWEPTYGDPEFAAGLETWRDGRSDGPGDSSAGVRLELTEGTVQYPVEVNGARIRLEAITARDSYNAALYTILNDADNPLVLKLTFAGEAADGMLHDTTAGLVSSGSGYAVVSIDY